MDDLFDAMLTRFLLIFSCLCPYNNEAVQGGYLGGLLFGGLWRGVYGA